MILKDKHTDYTSEEKNFAGVFKKGNIRSCEKGFNFCSNIPWYEYEF
jgi:hypothetical protein